MRASPELLRLVLPGLLSGFLVLGLGGRILMRLVAYATSATPRLTLAGTLQVLALGAVWGALTGPLWIVCHRFRRGWPRVLVFGSMSFGLAVLGFTLLTWVSGPLIAPIGLRLLAALTFPPLFLLHATLFASLVTKRSEPKQT